MSLISMKEFIEYLPKTELHLHIEGTFEPELMFKIAERNGIKLKYKSINELKKKYNFNNLQEFLDIYYAGANVLLYEQDFYDLTWAYLQKAHEQNIVHTEIFFDPQTHTERGIKFSTVIKGIQKALDDGKVKLGITSRLIPNFLRHLDESDAIKTFNEALEFRDLITGFGLDSSEVGNPPAKFQRVFKMVSEEGFVSVAHAGEEGSAQYIWDAIQLLNVARIDHGIRAADDALLIKTLAETKIPLTVCPLSNLKLQVVKNVNELPIKLLLQKEILVTINSDDPAYFGGYINENFEAVAKAFSLNKSDILKLAENSFKASFLDDKDKNRWLAKLQDYPKVY
ncbi:MAG: adenosine deaminase [Draconibacterium sp.]|nr:adenosine deaminase [Draconibacterium sp.]